MIPVILESPYSGRLPADILANVAYARKCVRDSLLRGEAPLASHLLYPQPGIFRDEIPSERRHGIAAGYAWALRSDYICYYVDRGWSPGMLLSLDTHIIQSHRDFRIRTFNGHALFPDGLSVPILRRLSVYLETHPDSPSPTPSKKRKEKDPTDEHPTPSQTPPILEPNRIIRPGDNGSPPEGGPSRGSNPDDL
jgi:hypothetical protein